MAWDSESGTGVGPELGTELDLGTAPGLSWAWAWGLSLAQTLGLIMRHYFLCLWGVFDAILKSGGSNKVSLEPGGGFLYKVSFKLGGGSNVSLKLGGDKSILLLKPACWATPPVPEDTVHGTMA